MNAFIAMLRAQRQFRSPNTLKESYLSKISVPIAISFLLMDELEPAPSSPPDRKADDDLARRLARYRRRVEAEGRPRSVRLIDQAIKDADNPGQ